MTLYLYYIKMILYLNYLLQKYLLCTGHHKQFPKRWYLKHLIASNAQKS